MLLPVSTGLAYFVSYRRELKQNPQNYLFQVYCLSWIVTIYCRTWQYLSMTWEIPDAIVIFRQNTFKSCTIHLPKVCPKTGLICPRNRISDNSMRLTVLLKAAKQILILLTHCLRSGKVFFPVSFCRLHTKAKGLEIKDR